MTASAPRSRATSPQRGEPAKLVAFVTAGYPEKREFLNVLRAVASVADAVEIGVPFSDPMADGVTIQRSSQHAIEHGVSLRWILDELARRDYELEAPVLLMSYLNPLLAFGGSRRDAFGYGKLAARAAEVGVSGFIVPDLPHEESAPLRAALDEHGLALVQLVTPATPPERLKTLCAASQGFVYAVTRFGITGGEATLPEGTAKYLAMVQSRRGYSAGVRRIRRAARGAGCNDRRARRRRYRRLCTGGSARAGGRSRQIPEVTAALSAVNLR